jgi:uncharacterized damage-inducible protein DinB
MQLPSSITTRLQYQHKSLIELIEGLTDEQIRRPVQPGKWSIFENIVHLATYQHTFNHRIRQILSGSNPAFQRYTAEADPLFHDNLSKSTREIMQDLLSTRKEMSAEIPLFAEEDFLKKGTHPFFGQMNMIQWLSFFLLHEAHHLFTVFKLAASLRNGITIS